MPRQVPRKTQSTPEKVVSTAETSCKESPLAWVGRKIEADARRVSRSTMSRIEPHLVAWVDAIALAADRMSRPIRCEHKQFERGSGARGNAGWVYVLHASATGLAKLGYTSASSLEKRVRTIQGYAPAELELVALSRGGTQLEALWHQQHKAHRRHLEWFAADAIVPAFRAAMAAAPPDGCARCVLMADRVAARR